jgi:hypothetical protein
VSYATARNLRQMFWRAALKAAAIAGVLGLSLRGAGTAIFDHTKPPRRAVTAEVTSISCFYRDQCDYQVFYTTAAGDTVNP